MAAIHADSLITLSQAKNYIGAVKSGDDEPLRRLIDEASSDCQDGYCSRLFLKRTLTDEKYDGTGETWILLKQRPVVSIASVTPYKNATALTTHLTHFDFDPDSGELRLLNGRTFPKSFREVKVTYDAGYDGRSNLPRDLVLSMKIAVAHLYHEKTKKTFSKTRQEMGERGTVEYIETVYPQRVLDIWKRYANERIGL